MTARAGRLRRLAMAIAGVALLVACGKSTDVSPRQSTRPTLTERLARAEASRRAAEANDPARSHLLGTIARKAIGPAAANAADGGIAVWIVAADHGGLAELVVAPFGADGAPLRAPRVVATVPREATSLVVRPTGRPHGGWLVAWTALLDRGESLSLLELGPDGAARGTPADLQRTSDHVAWADIVPTTRGAMCVWAEETSAGDANILATTVDANGKPRGVPARVARGVERWAAVAATGGGAALALVTRDKSSPAGLLSWLQLDAEGAAQGEPAAVGKEPTVGGDIDVVPFEAGWLLAWTDRTGEDPQVTLAAIDAAGHVEGPTRTIGAAGGSSLVALAAGAAGVALAWESPHRRSRPWHLLHLATVSHVGGLAAQPATSLEVLERAPAELMAAEDGFALLTTPVPSCYALEASGKAPPGPDPGDCRVVPTFLRYDRHLAAVQAEPLFVGETRTPATLAWGLHCGNQQCVALASTGEAPTPVFALDLIRRKSPFSTPGAPSSPVGAAHVTGVVTLASGEPYIDVAAARMGDATLLATLTNGLDAPTERMRGQSAKVAVRAYDMAGHPLEVGTHMTSRAVPVGRVAIAAIQQPELDAVAAWIARDDGDPQVHVARIDGHGHRAKEVQLTTAKGDASCVAIAWAIDGWLVAWVDSRDGNGEVYATKVDRNLNRVAPDQRVTRAPGDAADVALAVGAEVAWLAWSDPRESPREGVGDVYVTQIRTRDAKRTGDEVRVLGTAAHSRSPEIAVVEGGALVAWIEDTPSGVDAAGAAMRARLAPGGHVIGSPRPLVLGGEGRPTAVALESSGHGARAIVARSGRDGATLDAFDLSPNGESSHPWPVVDLDAPASFDVALSLAGDAVFYNDIGAGARDHRIRRLTISW
ncbi:MAG: hypothetical protein M3O46_14730 [Myxococcota bacterium]|nr:hypothetical protein [Myxococcota bacterium]